MSHTEHVLEMVATTEQSSVVGATSKESLIVEPVVKDLFTTWFVGARLESGAVAIMPGGPFATEDEAKAEATARRERKPYIRYVAVSASREGA